MRRLFYASGDVLISDVICKATLRYARALADSGQYDVVSLPVYGEDGEQARVHMLLGPSSQLFATPVPNGGLEDQRDLDIVRHLELRTRGLQPSRPDWRDEMRDVPDLDREVG